MPLFVKRSVWSPAGTRLALGTIVWRRSSKYSRNRLRISVEGSALIRGSLLTGGLDIGRNGTEQEGRPDRDALVVWPEIYPSGIEARGSRMHTLGLVLVLVVAAIHAYILVLEMF